jgi:hypothetical protein
MLSPDPARQALSSFFRRRPIADLEALFALLDTHSRMSVFRRLSDIGYYSSYSHTGRYYTLQDVPQFDREGLWRYEGVGFSRYGSLKSTVKHLVEEAEVGWTHHELHVRLQVVRVHNTLLELVRDRGIGRQPITGQYLYVSADPDRGSAQLGLRRQQQDRIAKATTEAPAAVVVDVLLAVIQSGRVQLDAERVAERLAARGLAVTLEQVEAVFQRYELKKTVRSRSRRSRP